MLEVKLNIVKKALNEKLASDILVLDVSEKTPFFTYYVLCTVKNIRQANACIDEIKENLAKANIAFKDSKGNRTSSWSILDLGDMLVHIFTEEERKHISLEKLLVSGEDSNED